jgi:hypothetical protein
VHACTLSNDGKASFVEEINTMTESNDKVNVSMFDGAERRTRLHLRDVFDRAYDIAYPLLVSKKNLNTIGSAHFLRVVLHDAFPEMHKQDIAILAVSIESVFRERNKPVSQ